MNKTLIITEPLNSEQVVFSQKIADEALARGWQVFECAKEDVFLEDGKVFGKVSEYRHCEEHSDEAIQGSELDPGLLRSARNDELINFDCIHFRAHPPVDIGYITVLQILKLVEDQVPIYNKPSTILNYPEKIFPHILGDYSPPTLISQDKNQILNFAKKHGEIVVKPLYGYGGFDIKKLSAAEIEHEDFDGIYIFQKFMEEVRHGTVRVNMLNGEIYGQLKKIPPQDKIESNFFEDDGLETVELTQTQLKICEKLKEYNLFFCGIDFLGDKLLEINITCPGTMGMQQVCGIETEKKIWDVIEGKC